VEEELAELGLMSYVRHFLPLQRRTPTASPQPPESAESS
jgi:hypothetical protein